MSIGDKGYETYLNINRRQVKSICYYICGTYILDTGMCNMYDNIWCVCVPAVMIELVTSYTVRLVLITAYGTGTAE